jgi:hypothetical protein
MPQVRSALFHSPVYVQTAAKRDGGLVEKGQVVVHVFSRIRNMVLIRFFYFIS